MQKTNIGGILTSIDQFGALGQISFFNNDVKFRTLYGGILSLLIYSVGFSYFFYLMLMWHTHQIPPIVTNQNQFIPELRFITLKEPFFVFSLEMDESNTTLQEQQKQQRIYNHDIYSSSNNYHDYLQKNPRDYRCIQPKSNLDYFQPICTNLNDEYQTNLAQNYQDRKQDVYVEFYVHFCDPKVDYECIDFVQQNQYLGPGQSNWRLTLITQDINLETGAIMHIPQDHYFPTMTVNDTTTLQIELKVQKGVYVIDDGIIFANKKVIEVVRSVDIQILRQPMKDPVSNLPVIAFISYSLDRQEELINVIYPRLGQVLAELGSIIQILLFFGIMVNKLNNTLMQVKVEQALLKIYFPLIDIFNFKNNWRGEITQITCNGNPLDGKDYEQLKQFRETSGRQVKAKLNITNILNEISKLQIAQQLMIPRDDIVRLQDLGYRVQFTSQTQNPHEMEDDLLDYEDFLLFTSQKYQDPPLVMSFGDNRNYTPPKINNQQLFDSSSRMSRLK